jgi:hypothetical protein
VPPVTGKEERPGAAWAAARAEADRLGVRAEQEEGEGEEALPEGEEAARESPRVLCSPSFLGGWARHASEVRRCDQGQGCPAGR